MYTRLAKTKIQSSLTDTRVVLTSDPRQSGKTTLAKDVASDDVTFLTLDDATVLQSALDDPVGFIRGLDRVVVDEFQRAPDLLLSIKNAVDENSAPGRFLLTGSANIMTIPTAADSLAGRMEVIRLLPLSQAELFYKNSDFIDNAFAARKPTTDQLFIGYKLIDAVPSGGYPQALERKNWARKQDWYHSYPDAIVQRDIREIAQIEQLALMPKLLSVLAEHFGQLINYTNIGTAIGLNQVTTRKYVSIFEIIYLVHTLQPLFSNRLKRLIKSPKLHFYDAGLLAAMQDVSLDVVRRDRFFVDRSLLYLKSLLEGRGQLSRRRGVNSETGAAQEAGRSARGGTTGSKLRCISRVDAGLGTGLRA